MRRKKSQIDLLRQYLQLGIGIMLTTSFTFLKVPKFVEVLQTDVIYGVLTITLFIVTCVWFIGWIYFDHKELQLFDDYIIQTDKKRLNLTPFLSMLCISLLCGVLLAISDQLRFYAPLTILNLFFGAVGYSAVHQKLTILYVDKKTYRTGPAKLICDYYLRKPFYLIDFLTIAFLTMALLAAWYSWFVSVQVFMYVGYVICILAIAIHEAILWKWRIARDSDIEKLEEQMDSQ